MSIDQHGAHIWTRRLAVNRTLRDGRIPPCCRARSTFGRFLPRMRTLRRMRTCLAIPHALNPRRLLQITRSAHALGQTDPTRTAHAPRFSALASTAHAPRFFVGILCERLPLTHALYGSEASYPYTRARRYTDLPQNQTHALRKTGSSSPADTRSAANGPPTWRAHARGLPGPARACLCTAPPPGRTHAR
jgi:hypothetical protein